MIMELRRTCLEKLSTETFDVMVVGGGINGAVSAACLSARGLRVALVDRGDFAGETSQHSSNLAWGGIKYLESYEFGLVRKLCASRNHLMASYPSSVREIRFFVTLAKGFRHGRLKLYLGALFYWLIGSFFTRPPRLLTNAEINGEEARVSTDGAVGGFEYSDAYLHDNDARFVWSFIRSALDYGAACANYIESTGASFDEGKKMWTVPLRDTMSGTSITAKARVLINAGGPYVDEHNARSKVETEHCHVFSKGIHLIVPRITKSQRVLTFFADDGRLFFVIPMGPRTCIGTTDTKVDSPKTDVTAADRTFVLNNINKRLKLEKPLTEGDIIAERCGVRPLATQKGKGGKVDWVQMSRKHAIDVNPEKRHLSIFGGKLTDCLNVGEEVAALLPSLDLAVPKPERKWYGEPDEELRERYFYQADRMGLDALTAKSSSETLSVRLWRRYGYFAFAMLEQIRLDKNQANLVVQGAEYTRCEIEHAAKHEMVTTLEDFLRRRSKIALVMKEDEIFEAPGLLEAARMFFGNDAERKIEAYFGKPLSQSSPARAVTTGP
jgi:glycerol-3-phosphate dehydrogenase